MKKKKILRMISAVLAVLLFGCAAPQPDPLETAESPESSTSTAAQETIPPGITAGSYAELAQLAAGDSLRSGDAVRLVGDMEITDEVVFTVPVSLSVEAKIVCTAPICVETPESGTMEVSVAEGIDADCLDIRFDAPNCDVWWLYGAPYDSEEQAAEEMNVRTYNGVDLRSKYGLGGVGNLQMLSFAIEPADNSALESSLSWHVEGNTAYLAVSYLIEDSMLKNAVVQITANDGTIRRERMDLSVHERFCSITDSEGNERRYKIITDRITYNLPVFYIEIEDGKEVTSREKYLSATLRIDTETAAGNFPELETTAILIRGRGHYSWNFDKTPYKIRFESKTSVLGLAASKNWVLLANYVDRSLIQNYIAMEMEQVMTNLCYHATQYPVDVFVNGSYRGVYTFGEQLEVKEERIDLETGYDEADTDYLLELGGADDGDRLGRDYFHAGTLKFVAIKHPDSTYLSPQQLDYLTGYVQAADEAVRTLTNYEDYIDVDSLIDWVILHELTYNLDCCFRRSCYMIKEKGGKLKMGPIWDFDLAFGNFYRYQEGDWATVGYDGGYVGVTWMNYLMKDAAFMERFTARWNEIKEPLLEKALASVDSMAALVGPSAEMNFAVWDILGQSVPSQPASHKQYDTYEKMIQRLKTFLQDRYDWMDRQLNG